MPRTKPARTLWERLTSNPVILKELRGRMRGTRAFIVLTVHLVVMSGFVALLYFAYLASEASSASAPSTQVIGKTIFGGVVGIELLLTCFITPAFTAGAVSGERERQTYDLLRTTLLPARSLILGKLTSALSYIILLLFAGVPLQSLAFLLGGVAPEEILIAMAVLITTALAFGSAGIFFSSLMRRTLGASVLSYAFALLANLALPILLLALIPFTGAFFINSPPDPLIEAALIYGFGILVALNPIAAAIATEIILVEEQSAFYFTTTLSNGLSLPLVSPWIVYVLAYLLLSLALVFLSVRVIRRTER